jgi:hypothetical protein
MVHGVNARWMDGDGGARSFGYFVRPGSDQPSAGVLVLHEAFGPGAGLRTTWREFREKVRPAGKSQVLYQLS